MQCEETTVSSTIDVGSSGDVAALLTRPSRPATALLVFAHGAGAGMTHAFMADLASALAAEAIATLRYQFPFIEQGTKRPDPPPVAHAAVRAAVAHASRALPGAPLFAGGKSFGGRMTSQAQALDPLPGVRGLVFVGFPLHPAGKPAVARAQHLAQVRLPMLFVQGTRDELAALDLITEVARALPRATLEVFEDADHAFHVRKRSGSTDRATLERIARVAADWMYDVRRT